MPEEPQLTAEEIDAALAEAHHLEWCLPDPSSRELRTILPMEMERVLQAAWGRYSDRANGALRREHGQLKAAMEALKTEQQSLEREEWERERAEKLEEAARELMEMLESAGIIPGLRAYNQIRDLLFHDH